MRDGAGRLIALGVSVRSSHRTSENVAFSIPPGQNEPARELYGPLGLRSMRFVVFSVQYERIRLSRAFGSSKSAPATIS